MSEDQKSKCAADEPASGLWVDPVRLPTRLAQRNPLASASLPQFLCHLRLNVAHEPLLDSGVCNRRKLEDAVLSHWLNLGDMLLKKQ